MTNKEVEFKYSAANISLMEFQKFCTEGAKAAEFICASGYDYFYESAKEPDSFCRLRSGADMHQLTFKKKTTEKNNFVRTEHNIDLARNMTQQQIEALLSEFGYDYNTTIFKNCFVYKYETHVMVYYICYSEDMKELGRFVEIEMREDYPWKNQNDAWNDLVALERLCKTLGVSPQARIKRSLFELFRADNARK